MREAERIADQLKRSFYGEAWSGPSVKEAVEGVTASMAVEHPLQDIHSIWELVHHVTAWVDIVRRRVERGVFTVSPEMNFPPVADHSEAAWQESLRRMQQAESELRKMTLQLPESRLDEPAVPGGSTVYVQLHGAVQHSLYHAGQIVVLKKCLVAGSKPATS